MSATNKVGTNSSETITADADDIFLWGEAGVDTIIGNDLGNTIGGGNDASADIINASGGDDTLLIQRGNDTLNGGSGYDIARLADYEVIDSGFFIGPVFVKTDSNGFEIASTLVGTPLNKSIISLDIGSETMRVGAYSFIDSSVGFGNFSGSNSAQDISLSGIDVSRGIMTVKFIQEYQLRNADDVFFGNELDHVINGRGGNDFIDGGDGADTIIGGDGTDTVSYQRSDAAVSVILSFTGLQSGGDAQNDKLSEIENLIGSSFGDFLSGTSGENRIEGQSGDDTLRGQGGNDLLFGGNGLDTLNGDSGFDVLNGGSENDTLLGGAAADILNGDAGTDTASYIFNTGAINVTRLLANPLVGKVFEHVGADTTTAVVVIDSTLSIDTLNSMENIVGSNFDDIIAGGDDINRLEGRNGRDVIRGNGGGDTILGGNQNDELHGDAGSDLLDGGADDDDLFGGIGNDTLRGGIGVDDLDGEADIDTAEFRKNRGSYN
jgi:Ca2+-binding RTX toxin-like protein